MLTGFNTDIDYAGVTYHVQTEDRGAPSSLIESLVYVRGEILATKRTEYRFLLEAGADPGAVRTLMDRQHRSIVEAIRNGRIDVITEPSIADESDSTAVSRAALAPAPARPLEAAKRSQRTLDEVIADWLAEQQRAERVRLQVEGGDDLHFGERFTLRVVVATAPGGKPLPHATVVVKLLSTTMKAVKLAEGSSDEDGTLTASGTLPPVDKGTGLVVVSISHPSGSDEVKFLVKR